jgi:hypothetical protein
MAIETQQSIFSEVADFIASQPTLEEIADYRISMPMQQHIDNLFEKNREAGLTPDERIEMEKILAVSHVMTLAKAKARLKLTNLDS